MTGAIYPSPSPAWLAKLAADEATALASLNMPRAWVAVDLAAARYNARCLRERAGVPLVAMLKADGYGVGAVALARALGASFADDEPASQPPAASGEVAHDALLWGIGVASVQEAVELREAGCTARLLCCTPLRQSDFALARTYSMRPSLHDAQDIAAWAALGTEPWHLSIDTGMSRAGARWDAVDALREVVAAYPPEGVFTHFHSADLDDGSRQRQESRFGGALRALRGALPTSILVHTDNSAAILSRGQALEAGKGSAPSNPAVIETVYAPEALPPVRRTTSPGHLARPGIAVHGVFGRDELGLRPSVQLRARVVDLREIAPGDTVGYGATWTAPSVRRIATVAAGYGDGYRRSLSNRGVGLLHGVRCPVVGRISMDMTLFDVTDVPCERGDVMTLVGRDVDPSPDHQPTDEIRAESVAATGDLSVYELLVGWRLRLPRVYYGAFSGTV
jgi:alanine racemase